MYLGTIIDPPGIAGSMATLLSPISTLYRPPARARSRYFPIRFIPVFLRRLLSAGLDPLG